MSPEAEYWERRYGSGGSSGPGSVGKGRQWKWTIIDSNVKDLDDVIDIGCGDLSFWEDRRGSLPRDFRYFGLDISRNVVERNRTRYSDWAYQVGNASDLVPDLQGRIVLCLDVLFHIMDDETYIRILENLARYSLEWIFVFTWWKNPFNFRWRLWYLGHTKHATRSEGERSARTLWALLQPGQLGRDLRFLVHSTESDGLYQRYRRFEDYTWILERQGFALVGKHRSPYHRAGAMYVFHKKGLIRSLAV